MSFIDANKPLVVAAPDGARLTYEGTAPGKPLPRGTYKFRLVVTDDAGVDSDPFDVNVTVLDKPVASFRPVGVLLANQPFVLDGSSSSDPNGGKLVRYTWTFLGRADVITPGIGTGTIGTIGSTISAGVNPIEIPRSEPAPGAGSNPTG